MRSSPIVPMQLEASEPPLALRREMLAGKFIVKSQLFDPSLITSTNQLSLYDLTHKYWDKKKSPPLCSAFRNVSSVVPLDQLKQSAFNHIQIEDYIIMIQSPHVIIPVFSEIELQNAAILREILSEHSNSLQIYTDASKSASGTGFAVYTPSNKAEIKRKLPDSTSIFCAEAFAIAIALKTFRIAEHDSAFVLSDSLSVLKALQGNEYPLQHSCLSNCISELILLKKMNKTLRLVWVKAHIGIQHNEYVDQLAKDSANTGIEHSVQPCWSWLPNKLKLMMREDWCRQYRKYCSAKQSWYTSVQSDIPRQPWFKDLNLPRASVTSITRLRLGHGSYPAHLNRIGVVQSDRCDVCLVRCDLNHLFLGCEKYTDGETEVLIKDLASLKEIQFPLNLEGVLNTGSVEAYMCLIRFLNSTSLNI